MRILDALQALGSRVDACVVWMAIVEVEVELAGKAAARATVGVHDG